MKIRHNIKTAWKTRKLKSSSLTQLSFPWRARSILGIVKAYHISLFRYCWVAVRPTDTQEGFFRLNKGIRTDALSEFRKEVFSGQALLLSYGKAREGSTRTLGTSASKVHGNSESWQHCSWKGQVAWSWSWERTFVKEAKIPVPFSLLLSSASRLGNSCVLTGERALPGTFPHACPLLVPIQSWPEFTITIDVFYT